MLSDANSEPESEISNCSESVLSATPSFSEESIHMGSGEESLESEELEKENHNIQSSNADKEDSKLSDTGQKEQLSDEAGLVEINATATPASKDTKGTKRSWSLMLMDQQDETLRLDGRIKFNDFVSNSAFATPLSSDIDHNQQPGVQMILNDIQPQIVAPTFTKVSLPHSSKLSTDQSTDKNGSRSDDMAMASYKLETIASLKGEPTDSETGGDRCEALLSPEEFAIATGNQIFVMSSDLSKHRTTIHHGKHLLSPLSSSLLLELSSMHIIDDTTLDIVCIYRLSTKVDGL